jgi:hypothetical protein
MLNIIHMNAILKRISLSSCITLIKFNTFLLLSEADCTFENEPKHYAYVNTALKA